MAVRDEATFLVETKVSKLQGLRPAFFIWDICFQICARAHGEEYGADA